MVIAFLVVMLAVYFICAVIGGGALIIGLIFIGLAKLIRWPFGPRRPPW